MRYYLVDNDPDQRYENIDDLLDNLVTQDYFLEDENAFDEYLDDEYGSVEIAGYEWSASDVLSSMDRTGYENEMGYWADGRVTDEKDSLDYDFRQAESGDCIDVCGYDVYVYDEEDGDFDGDDELSPEEGEAVIQAVKSVVNQQLSQEEKEEQKETAFESMFQYI